MLVQFSSSSPHVLVLLKSGATKDLWLLDLKFIHFIHLAQDQSFQWGASLQMNNKSKRWGVYPRENRSLYNSHFKSENMTSSIFTSYLHSFPSENGLYSWSPPWVPLYKTFHWNWHSVDHHEIWQAKSVKEKFFVPWIFDFAEEFESSDCQLCPWFLYPFTGSWGFKDTLRYSSQYTF